MKKQFFALLASALIVVAAQPGRASVVVSNLDPANPAFGLNSPAIGQALLIGSRPVSLTSVMFLQTGGTNPAAESFAVYGRNANGTLGSPVFSGFTVGFDSASNVSTATVTVTGAFTLQANTGYYFVLTSNSGSNVEWTYTSSTDYAAAFGASLPAGNDSFFTTGTTTVYRSLTDGPQEFQVNGSALPAVPEPSAVVLAGLALVGGAAGLARRRSAV